MAQTIKLKRSGTQNAVPSTSQLALGEVALNTYDGKMYIKKSVGGTESIVEIGGDATSSSGLDFTGNLNLADNVRIVIGDGNDLQIYHDGSNSIIQESGTGDLRIRAQNLRLQDNDGTNFLYGVYNGRVELFHNNSKKFETTSTGISVTGNISGSGGLGVSGNITVGSSSSAVISLERASSNYILANNSGTGRLHIGAGSELVFLTGQSDGDYTQNEKIRIDSSGRLLVNTTSSIDNLAKIQVVGDSSSLARITLQDVDGTNQKTYFEQSNGGTRINTQNGTSNGIFTIGAWNGTTSSDFLRVDSSGQVGIGTTSPQRQLHIVGSDVATGIRLEADTAADATLELLAFDGNNTASIKTLGGNDALVLGTAGTEALRIDSSQRVGIGTTSPTHKLQVVAAGGAYSGGDHITSIFQSPTDHATYLKVKNTNTNSTASAPRAGIDLDVANHADSARARTQFVLRSIAGNDSGGDTSITVPRDLRFFVNNESTLTASSGEQASSSVVAGTEAMRIDSGGNLLVGATSQISSGKISVAGGTSANGITATTAATSGYSAASLQRTASDGDLISFKKGADIVGSIGTKNGALYFGKGSTTISVASNAVLPKGVAGVTNNGAIDLGGTSQRFKDLHLSGQVNTGTISSGAITSTGAVEGASLETNHTINFGYNSHYLQAGTGSLFWKDNNGASLAGFTSSGFNTSLNYQIAGTTVIDGSRNITSANITTTGYLRGPSTFTIDPAAHGDNTGTVVIAGNLQVDGTTTTINSTTLTVDDKNITLASGSTNAAAANGAGLTVDCGSDTNATFTYEATPDSFRSNKNFEIYTNGNLGQLSVGRTSDQAIRLYADDNYNRIFAYQDADSNTDHFFDLVRSFAGTGRADFRIINGTDVHMLVDKTGKVGIGITDPATNLHISSTDSSTLTIQNSTNAGNASLHFRDESNVDQYKVLYDLPNNRAEQHFNGNGLRFYSNQISAEVAKIGFGNGYNSSYFAGRVGIGTTSPAADLHVNGTWTTNRGTISINGPANALTGVGITSNNIYRGGLIHRDGTAGQSLELTAYSSESLLLKTTNTTRLAITSGGNVGIGTASPQRNLDVRHGLNIFGSGGYTELMLRGRAGTAQNLGAWHWSIRGDVGGANDDLMLLRFTGGNSPSYAGTSMHIRNDNGYVGIGTNTGQPSAHLHVKDATGEAKVLIQAGSNTSSAVLQFGDSLDTSRGGIEYTSTDDMAFSTNNMTEAMRIRYTGNVGIGTSGPGNRLEVKASGNDNGIMLKSTTNADLIWLHQQTTSEGVLRIYGSGGAKVIIPGHNSPTYFNNGNNFGIGTTSPSRKLEVGFTGSTVGARFTRSDNAGSSTIEFANSAGVKSTIGFNAGTNKFDIQHNAAVRLSINNSGAATFNEAFTFPTSDGSANQVLKTDGSGNVTWATEAAVSANTSISDTDGDTKIQVEEGTDDDTIRFDTAGTQRMRILSNGLVAIGNGADSPTEKLHVFDNINNSQVLTSTGTNTRGAIIKIENDNTTSGAWAGFDLRTNTGDARIAAVSTSTADNDTDLAFIVDDKSAGAGVERLRIKGETGNIGIGTPSPSSNLHVKTGNVQANIRVDSNGTNAAVFFANPGGNFGVWGFNNTRLSLATNGTERMSILGTGNVGIGTTSPGRKLTVQGASGDNLPLRIVGGSGTNHGSMEFQDPNTTADYKVTIGSKTDDFYIQAGGTEKVRVLANGNVGIGTTSPDIQLHVKSATNTFAQVKVEAAADGHDSSVAYSQAGTIKGISGYDDSTNTVAIKYGTFGGDGIDIDSNGNVGIGTASPTKNLHVYYSSSDTSVNTGNGVSGGGAGTGLLIQNADSTANTYANLDFRSNNADGRIAYKYTGTTNVGDFHFITDNNGSPQTKLFIKDSGYVGINNTDPTTYGTLRVTQKTANNAGGIAVETGTVSARLYVDGSGVRHLTAGTTDVINWTTSGNVGIGTATPASRLEVKGTTADNSADALNVRDSSNNQLFRVRNDGVVLIGDNYLYVTSSQGAYFDGSVKFRNGITDDTGQLSLNSSTGDITFNSCDLESVGNITTSGYLRGPSTFTIDPAAHGDNTGTVVIAGNLQVDGTTTTINSTTLTVDDKNITLASGASNAAAANGAGLTVDCGSDTDATFSYQNTGDRWTLNKPLHWTYATATTALSLNNNNIVGVNNIAFADAGANEGLQWSNIRIFESPNDLSNASGNFQVTYGGTRRLTVDNTGIDVNGTVSSGAITSTGASSFHDITFDGVMRSTNNANVDGPNFNVSTINKSTTEYAYRVDRSNAFVGGIRIDGGFSTTANIDLLSSASSKINLHQEAFITFYGNSNHHHAIGSRALNGSASDDLRINSYGGVLINLDSNSNNTSGADFVIGRHGAGTGTMSSVLTVSGEDGGITTSGNLLISKTDPTITLFDNSGANTNPNGTIIFSEVSGTNNFKINYNGQNDRLEFRGLVGSTDTELVRINRGTNPALHIFGREYLEYSVQATANKAYGLVVRGNDSGSTGEAASIFLGGIQNTVRGAYLAAEIQSASNDHDLIIATSGPSAEPSERMRVTGDGKVGIGASDPGAKLHLSTGNSSLPSLDGGTLFVIDTTQGGTGNYAAMSILSGTSGVSSLYFGDEDAENRGAVRYFNTSNNLAFNTNGQERVRIDNTGKVGINQNVPAYQLDVNGNARIYGMVFNASGAVRSINTHSAAGLLQLRGGTSTSDGAFINIAGDSYGTGDYIQLYAGNTYISGNLGVAESSPSARFQVEALGIDTTTTTTSATTEATIDSFAAATFRSARYTIQVTNTTDSTYHMTEILLIHNGTTPNITEYGTVFTGTTAEATFDADISSGNVRLRATPASPDSMTFKVVRHCITV